MKKLEEKIVREGKVYPGNVLKVGNFLNHQIDTVFLKEMCEEMVRLYKDAGVTKVLTVESSGIAIAAVVAMMMQVPLVFAKKNKSSNISSELYCAVVHSFTHNSDFNVVVEKDYINKGDRILIVDDFLAIGNAVSGLVDIVHQAEAEVVGVTVAIEKGFLGGGDHLREIGIRVDSMAIVDSMTDDGKITFRQQ